MDDFVRGETYDVGLESLYRALDDNFPYSVELSRVFVGALEQHSYGKGAERHGGGPFVDQPINRIPDMLGGLGDGFLLGQAIKKIQESSRMGPEAALRELEGAMVYLGTAAYRLKKGHNV